MHIEPHFMLGWTMGNLGAADRRLRTACALGGILPDIDSLPIVFGIEAYGRFHHTFGHNVFLWAGFVAWTTWRFRSQRAFWLSFASFGSHLVADAWLSGWSLAPFWPAWHWEFLLPGGAGLEAPINVGLVYASLAAIPLLAWLYQRTPLEILSSRLDQIVLSLFRRRIIDCGFCGKKGNNRCEFCGKAVCARHGRIDRKLRVTCPACTTRHTN